MKKISMGEGLKEAIMIIGSGAGVGNGPWSSDGPALRFGNVTGGDSSGGIGQSCTLLKHRDAARVMVLMKSVSCFAARSKLGGMGGSNSLGWPITKFTLFNVVRAFRRFNSVISSISFWFSRLTKFTGGKSSAL